MWGKKPSDKDQPPRVYYCLHCGMEAVIGDPPKSCTMCLRDKFATADEYDEKFLKSLKIRIT